MTRCFLIGAFFFTQLPWVSVFSRGAMDAFLIKNILPKLATAVKNWNINPSQQQLGKLFSKFPYERGPFLWLVCDEHLISSLLFFSLLSKLQMSGTGL